MCDEKSDGLVTVRPGDGVVEICVTDPSGFRVAETCSPVFARRLAVAGLKCWGEERPFHLADVPAYGDRTLHRVEDLLRCAREVEVRHG